VTLKIRVSVLTKEPTNKQLQIYLFFLGGGGWGGWGGGFTDSAH